MGLSNDLVSQFVKITRDQTVEKRESIVYGTTIEYNSKMYVKIDGSDLITPVETTTDMQSGERVTVLIKDHTATVTGNISSPAPSTSTVTKIVQENALAVEELIADKATIKDLEATNAKIENLKTENAEIKNLVADKATIKDLEATNAKIENLKTENAEIKNLVADKASIKDLEVINADIVSLKADRARIEVLEAEYADINTLVNGNLTSDNIQSLHLTSANTTIDNALIKDAMIDTVSANKINSGTINTNNVNIQSEDGSMLLQGNLQQFKDANGNVRIQIGKDASGNFSFVLYDESGTGQLINQNGIQSSNAIADGLIVDAKVAEGANISGSKLDISSVVTEINEGTTTIKGSKVYLDDKSQTLEVAFNSLSTTVENLKVASGDVGDLVEKVSTNTTNIQIAQGQIETLITNTTITKENGEVIQLKDAYNSTVDTVNSHTTKIGSLETNYLSADNRITTVESKQTELEQSIDGFKQTVSKTYTTKDEYNNLADDLHTNYSTSETMNSAIEQKATSILSTVSSTYVRTDEMTGEVTTINNSISKLEQSIDGFKQTVSKTYTTKDEHSNLADDLHTNYSTTASMNSAIEQKANSILSTVSGTYVTTDEMTGEVTTINNSISEVRQESNKISWLIKSGTSSSNMELTDSALSVIANNINLTGKVTFSCLDNSTQNTINTANSNASSAKSTLDNNSSDWTNAYNRVVEWASGDVTGSTTINGGLIQTGTVTADKIQGRELIGVTLRNSSNTFRVDGEGNIIGASITNSTGGNWSIDTDGNMETKNMNIEGEISADEITCNKINNPNYPESLSGDIQLYVDAINGSDDIELEDGATFKSLNGALDALPRNLNNWVAKIMLQTNVTENVTVRNINTGRLYIQLNNKTLYGWIDVVQNMGLQVFLLGGTAGTSSTNDYGYIKPTEGKARTGGVFSIAALDTFSFTLYNIAVYAPTVNQSGSAKGALHCSNFVKAYINNIKIYHTLSGSTFNTGFDNMIRSYSDAYVYIAESHGLSKNYTYYAQSGSTICLNNATQCGRYNSTARVNTNSAGEVRWSTEPTWDGSGTSGSSDAGTTVTTKTYTKTYKSTSGDTYRSTVYNNWKKDGTVRQGDYGYGDCNGCWFFGTQFAEVKGKNITKVQITITRQTGGTSAPVNLAIKTHNYSSRPSGSPSYVGSVGTLSIATGNSETLPITNTSNAIITGLKNGTIKGIGLQSSYTSALYAVCSGTCTVKVTYTE